MMTDTSRPTDHHADTETPAETVEQQPKPTMLDQMGGPSGVIYSGLPVVVFVIANAVGGLSAGVWSAVAFAAALAVFRLLRREPVQPAVSGLFGVAVAAGVAYWTGSAKDFFLLNIWQSLICAVLVLFTVVVRRPLVGLVWNALNSAGNAWRADRVSLRAYDIATLTLVAVFAARFVVQQWLYDGDHTGWLAFARIAMGYPLTGLAVLVMLWAVRRSKKSLAARQA
ncbi:DUF3159 domain-containing protein [Nocardia sp. NPDC003345]